MVSMQLNHNDTHRSALLQHPDAWTATIQLTTDVGWLYPAQLHNDTMNNHHLSEYNVSVQI